MVTLEMAQELLGVSGKAELLREGNIAAKADAIWSHFFRTDTGLFLHPPRNCVFAHVVQTDGESLRVLFKSAHDPGRTKRGRSPPTAHETYLSEVDPTLYADRNIGGGDPGLKDMIYFSDDNGLHLRYMADQRRKETRFKGIFFFVGRWPMWVTQ